MENTYCILTAADVTTAQWRVVVQNPKTARYSLDDTLVVLKWAGETPVEFAGLPTLTHAEVLVELEKPSWTHQTE